MDKRIVSLLPSCTEIICKLGYKEHLVGISHECDYPNSISGLPVLTKARLSLEGTTIELNQSDDQINIIIIDNGIGFESLGKNIKNILNPYYTTKKNGTGLGLSIVNNIINDHNGYIEFISIENGAKIKINFNK